MRRSAARLVAAFAAAGTLACASEPAPTERTEPTVTVVDGVRLVENHAPAWDDGAGWRISEAPILTLGVDAGEPYEMFTYPDVVRLANEIFIVVDRLADELRAFDKDGNHLWTAGGRGQGPGEFEGIEYAFPTPGNGVLVSDSYNFRLTEFSSDGTIAGTFELVEHDDDRYFARPRVSGVFADGSLLATSPIIRSMPPAHQWPVPAGQRGWIRDGLFRYSADGAEYTYFSEVDLWEVGQSEGWPVPFSARGFTRPHSRGFYYMNGRSSWIEDYDADGKLRARFRSPLEPVPVTVEARDRWLQKSLENFEEAGQELRPERRDGMVFPETMPTRQELIVDSEDNAWAERFLGLQHSQPMSWGVEAEPGFPETDSVWDVFNPEGIWLGAVELIPDRAVRQIGNDWVLFGGEDDDGVHHVWLYGLIKEDSGR